MSTNPNPARPKRLWPRWLALAAFVIVLSMVFIKLGEWQLSRLDQKRHRNDVVATHENEPPLPFEQAFTKPIEEDDQWRRVTATGTYDAHHQIVVRYRHVGGKQGYELLTPLTAGGRTVLVDRGFVQSSPGDEPVALQPPSGTVTVTGYIRRNERGDDKARVPVDGQVRLIDSAAIAHATNLPLVDGYLSVIETTPADDARLTPLTPPPADEGPHLSYALQWFSFCLLAAAGLVVFIRADLRERKKARDGHR